MRKRTLLVGIILVLAVAWCMTAYAGDGGGEAADAWNSFWGGVGGFLYNALPWNWGNWAGK